MEPNPIATLVQDLTSQLSGIADEFTRRAADIVPPPRASIPSASLSGDAELVAVARRLTAQRRARSRFLPAELFHEPAWDMLLALFVAQHERRAMNVKTLVSYSEAPATTSQRWIDHLHKLGLIDRVTDMIDRRRVEIGLSEAGDAAIRSYLSTLV